MKSGGVKEFDPLRDGPLRYLGYSNECGCAPVPMLLLRPAFASWQSACILFCVPSHTKEGTIQHAPLYIVQCLLGPVTGELESQGGICRLAAILGRALFLRSGGELCAGGHCRQGPEGIQGGAHGAGRERFTAP